MNSFLATTIGYIGAFSMAIGFGYYVFTRFALSWKLVELLGYLLLAGIFSLPFSSFVQNLQLSTNFLRLTTFLGLILLPIMIMLTLIVHVERGDNPFLAGIFICAFTAFLSLYFAHTLDSKIIAFYGIIHALTAVHFVMLENIKDSRTKLTTIFEMSFLICMIFMGIGLYQQIGQGFNKDLRVYERFGSYATVIGLSAGLFSGICRTCFETTIFDLILVLTIVGLYYLIDVNLSLRYIEFPLNSGTAFYVFRLIYINFYTKGNFPLFLIVAGAALYGLSLVFQMRRH